MISCLNLTLVDSLVSCGHVNVAVEGGDERSVSKM